MSQTTSIPSSASGPLHDATAGASVTGIARGVHAPTDGSELVSRVAQGLHETVDRVAEKAGPAVQKIEVTVHDQMNRARELSDEYANSLRGTVRERPLTSVLVALAAGVILSRITR